METLLAANVGKTKHIGIEVGGLARVRILTNYLLVLDIGHRCNAGRLRVALTRYWHYEEELVMYQ